MGLPRYEAPPPRRTFPSTAVVSGRSALATLAGMRLADEKPGWWVFLGEQPQGHYAADSLRTAKRNGYEVLVRQLGPARHGAYLRAP